MPKEDWSRPLDEPVDLGDGHVLRTLRDVIAYLANLPPERHELKIVQHIAHLVEEAALGKDVGHISVPLRLARRALHIEN